MVVNPTVTIITPTTHDRERYNERIKSIAQYQDYQNIIEHLFDYSPYTIGDKRNNLCEHATGDIIVHFDSDDYYAPDWISKSVQHLLSQNADITGLSSIYFYRYNTHVWEWRNISKQPILAGATFCYWRKIWQRNPFKSVNSGEDTKFCTNAGRISPHDYNTGFLATIHGNNTASHLSLTAKEVTLHPISIAHGILGDQLPNFRY